MPLGRQGLPLQRVPGEGRAGARPLPALGTAQRPIRVSPGSLGGGRGRGRWEERDVLGDLKNGPEVGQGELERGNRVWGGERLGAEEQRAPRKEAPEASPTRQPPPPTKAGGTGPAQLASPSSARCWPQSLRSPDRDGSGWSGQTCPADLQQEGRGGSAGQQEDPGFARQTTAGQQGQVNGDSALPQTLLPPASH